MGSYLRVGKGRVTFGREPAPPASGRSVLCGRLWGRSAPCRVSCSAPPHTPSVLGAEAGATRGACPSRPVRQGWLRVQAKSELEAHRGRSWRRAPGGSGGAKGGWVVGEQGLGSVPWGGSSPRGAESCVLAFVLWHLASAPASGHLSVGIQGACQCVARPEGREGRCLREGAGQGGKAATIRAIPAPWRALQEEVRIQTQLQPGQA